MLEPERCDWRHEDGNDHRGAGRGSRPPGRPREGARMSAPTTTARLLPGKPVAEAVLADVAARVAALRERGITPSLATLLVGDDDASAGYIRIKQQQAADLGFASPHEHLPASATQADVEAVIKTWNDDPAVHGMLVQ